MLKKSAFIVTVFLLTGCGNTVQKPTYQGIDPDRLLHIAGQQAGSIDNMRERLARQLNIANRETNNGHPDQARTTLLTAKTTLESAASKDLSDHQRLAGWISLSELNRQAADARAAEYALDKAIENLNKLLPVYARPEYVHGIAREVNALRGEKASAKMIATATDWVVEMPEEATRRQAILSFAYELFRCNDYDGATKMLQCDKDAAWRSDSLIAMADRERNLMNNEKSIAAFDNRMTAPSISPSAKMPADTAPPSEQQFGRQLDFRSNFYKNK